MRFALIALGIILLAISLYPTFGERTYNEGNKQLADDEFYSTTTELGWPLYSFEKTITEGVYCVEDCTETSYSAGFGVFMLLAAVSLLGSQLYLQIKPA